MDKNMIKNEMITEPQQKNQQQDAQQQDKNDLIQRVSQHKPNIKTDEKNVLDEVNFNINDIEKIEDPLAKEYAQKAYKSFQRGFNQKFQELAELRKQIENEKTEFSNWTPEKIQQLLKDENFVSAAQSVYQNNNPSNSGMTDEQWSTLSDAERAEINYLKQNNSNTEKKLNQTEQKINQILIQKEDELLTQRYANYDSSKVNKLRNDLLSGNVSPTREMLWKILDHDSAIERAYQLGLQDRNLDIKDKIDAISPDGVAIPQAKDVPQKENKESDRDYFKRLALRRLAQRQQMQRR